MKKMLLKSILLPDSALALPGSLSKAEEIIRQYGRLYCLGEIVHNQKEIERLEGIGLQTITYDEYLKLSDCRVLIRAHGEPPETYEYAIKNNIELIDGTCPIVLRLQSRIKKDFADQNGSGAQIIIFGKKDHAEVRGLAGQTNYQTVIMESEADLEKIDFSRPVHLYAQTTMSPDKYRHLKEQIVSRAETGRAGILFRKMHTVDLRPGFRKGSQIEGILHKS